MVDASGWLHGIDDLFKDTTGTASFCDTCLGGETHCGSCPCCGSVDDAPFTTLVFPRLRRGYSCQFDSQGNLISEEYRDG